MHGPLSIVFGILAGLVAALICAPTKLWNNIYKRTTVVFFLGPPFVQSAEFRTLLCVVKDSYD